MLLFITATDTGVGKTYTTLQLLQIAHNCGYRVAAIKPIETGVISSPEDGSKLLRKSQELNPNLKDITIEDVVPYRFALPAAPFVAKDAPIDLDYIKEKITLLQSRCDILFIEGAGGLMVPIEKNYFMIDLIKDLDAPALLVTPSKLGCINQTLLSMEALHNKGIPFWWYVNLYEDRDEYFQITHPFYESYFKEVPLSLDLVFNRYTHAYIA